MHGEVRPAEIVSGYEYASGQYVLFDPAELETLRSAKDKTINISAFIPPGAVDPVYHAGGTYYLAPEGAVAQKPYALIREVMEKEGQYAFAQVVLRNASRSCCCGPWAR